MRSDDTKRCNSTYALGSVSFKLESTSAHSTSLRERGGVAMTRAVGVPVESTLLNLSPLLEGMKVCWSEGFFLNWMLSVREETLFCIAAELAPRRESDVRIEYRVYCHDETP
jgi:hypothetical protein